MYVTPRPKISDDPLYAVRLAATGALAYAAIPLIDPALPPVIAALPVGLIAAQRMAFSPIKALAGPIVFIAVVWIVAFFVEHLRPMPIVYIVTMGIAYFAGYRMILSTGAQAGMLIIVVTVLLSVMGMNSIAALDSMKESFTQASLLTFVLMPLLFTVLPPRSHQTFVEFPVPDRGNINVGAGIRANVLLLLSFWLYAVMQPSDMMMAIIAAMVLVFPTRQAVFSEAVQRIRATCYGGAVALLILSAMTVVPHLSILLLFIFLGGLFFGNLMLTGTQPSMVYQYSFSVTLALIAGALSTQDPSYATFTRIALTLAGALSATLLIALLDALTGWNKIEAGEI